ncbi:hypothetical protein J2Z52_001574 [Enterococcus rivorum]|uniref:Uncharacterized protein n=1 Tax=Enterococcus rivorum TaxID=762845 RepID=A0A1E5L1N5_9ENTE|nr:hypothetical protein [Enterococcus rivorum]OEH83951.1 hypothetical protein BCR26_00305 [Enterococcus rivorum]
MVRGWNNARLIIQKGNKEVVESLKRLKKEFGVFEIIRYENLNQSYEGLLLATGNNELRVRSRLAKKTLKKRAILWLFGKEMTVKKINWKNGDASVSSLVCRSE